MKNKTQAAVKAAEVELSLREKVEIVMMLTIPYVMGFLYAKAIG